ncbi:hypothetical protein CS063_14890 [Sporanaerobium hydrogeniformans]|uniref:Uncharacterized protein n=1 Tax=Sporanaerobium hydrogeniformans TaxID=3072179 RepID=A0AC61D7Y0_9FIRM|nr:DUF262 domain-containing protein [Sporanaerobium hydrogeniformans]PHV69594.1 hypothetical protein CS063_14890 [Sporanaerobium hydrogeniformans]
MQKNYERLEEEYYGIENEQDDQYDNEETIEYPFDADMIRVDQQMLSLEYLYRLMKEQNLDLSPTFQRSKVWKEKRRKSLLIESLMLRIPIPAFYFYENENATFTVIDGKQRLTTIRDFLNDDFALYGLEYLHACEGKKFSQLDAKYQQRIYRTQFAINTLDVRSPHRVVFDIFRRVNTGGVALNPQEIRNAMASEGTRQFLKKLSKLEVFKKATRARINDDRMAAQEVVLRYIAFKKLYDEQKGNIDFIYGDVTSYLDTTIMELRKAAKDTYIEYEESFAKAMKMGAAIFGKFAFTKCYLEGETIYNNLDIINKTLFTSWSVVLSDPKYQREKILGCREEIVKQVAYRITYDTSYANAITLGTNGRRSVNIAFEVAKEILEEVLHND